MSSLNPVEAGTENYTAGQTRTLTVRFDNWKWRKATISGSDENAKLYRIECHMRKPQIILQSLLSNSASTEASGDASFHTLSSRIDIRLHDQRIELISRGSLKNVYTYVSHAFDGAKMTWQSRSIGRDFNIVCLDEKAIPVAQISLGSWSLTKAGTIELTGARVMNQGPEMDEIVLTGIAIMQQRLTTYAMY